MTIGSAAKPTSPSKADQSPATMVAGDLADLQMGRRVKSSNRPRSRARLTLSRHLQGIVRAAFLNEMSDPALDRHIQAIERPDKALWTYYILTALVIPPLFPILIIPLYFRYHTMRYRFTDDGISMSWGILFHRQTIVNYARIQDIHLRSNLVERWLGLARILVQTASGNQSAEMTIEGVKDFEALRDFLYARMHGVKDSPVRSVASIPETSSAAPDELTATLRETVTELRAIRELLEKRTRPAGEDTRHV